MKEITNHQEYNTPKTETIEIKMESILCQSGYKTTLENMSESDYDFTF